MASGRKSLSDFLGHSWSSWSENAGNLISPDEDEEDENESTKKGSEVMRLFSSDMEKFGLFPETDVFYAVVCNECGSVVKAQGLLTHMRLRHRGSLQNRLPLEKVFKHGDSKQSEAKHSEGSSASSGGSDKLTAKYMLNEKLMSKLALSDKLASKSGSSEKFSGSPNEKHGKANSEKSGSKHSSSEKFLSKSNEKLSSKSSEKTTKSNEKTKSPSEKSGTVINDKLVLRADSDKSFKSSSDTSCKQVEQSSSKSEKSSKILEKLPGKALAGEKFNPKYGLLDKTASSKASTLIDKLPASRSGEKISAKSILNEKLLLKAAANDKFISSSNKVKNLDCVKVETVLKADKSLARPIMKSLLKEKILKGDGSHSLVPGSSILKSSSDREIGHVSYSSHTSLSPPVLIPQNRPLELHQSATDMPILSRKRKFKERKAIPTLYDPDRHCGVWCDYFNKFCVRSLTCKAHSVASRRAVVGRSKPFDQLLIEHRRAKEDMRVSKDEQDDASEASPQLSERVESSSEPSSSPFPYASPASSPAPSVVQGTTLSTPSMLTTPPIPSLSYQYPPYPPPLPASPSLPDNTVTLSPHLSSPLLNVALPGLSPSHGARPETSEEYGSVAVGKAKIARAAAREINRLQLNKGRQFNVKHGAFPPKPLRTCLFQGRKSSGMFITQRELEAMRSGFRSSIAEASKNTPLSHLSLASQSPAHISVDNSVSHNAVSIHTPCDSSMPNQSTTSSSQVNSSSGLKSVLGTLCAAKTVINQGDIQQRVPRAQKFTILVLTE